MYIYIYMSYYCICYSSKGGAVGGGKTPGRRTTNPSILYINGVNSIV